MENRWNLTDEIIQKHESEILDILVKIEKGSELHFFRRGEIFEILR